MDLAAISDLEHGQIVQSFFDKATPRDMQPGRHVLHGDLPWGAKATLLYDVLSDGQIVVAALTEVHVIGES